MRLRAKFESSGAGDRRRPTAVTMRAGNRKPTPVSPAARNLALAHYLQRLIDRGVIADYSQAARMLGVSQPRMTHLMGLLLLSPAVQEAILLGQIAPTDKELRELARVAEWAEQGEALYEWHVVRRRHGK